MPSKKTQNKNKPNVSPAAPHREESRFNPPPLDPEAGPAHFCSAWLRPPPRVAPPPINKNKTKNNLSISQPLSFSRPARATMISPIPRVSTLNKLSLLRCVPFRGYVPNKEREKKHIKTNEQLSTKQKTKRRKAMRNTHTCKLVTKR